MSYRIHITAKAERDLIEAVDYIEYTLLNQQAANNLLDKTEEVINKLSFMPDRFKIVDDPVLSAWEIRMIVINNYLAFYVIDKESEIVHIVRFLYGKRNWISLLRNEAISLD